MTLPAITGHLDHDKAYDVFPEKLKPYRPTILAYSASLVQMGVGYPLDTVKVKMQAYRSFTGYSDCIKQTYQTQGLAGFYRGILSPLLLTSLVRTLNVMLFSGAKPIVAQYLDFGKFGKDHPYIANVPVCFLSGAFAGFNTTFILCPFEYIKVVMQLQRGLPSNVAIPSLGQVVKLIVKYDGYLGLYRGFKYHAPRDAIGSGIYFATYELVKSVCNRFINGDPLKPSPVLILVAGGALGIMGWLCIYPIDTLKLRYQKGVVKNIFRKARSEKPIPVDPGKLAFNRDMFRGLGILMTRTFLVNLIFFSMYEFTMAHFE